jgi:uncharacterized protein
MRALDMTWLDLAFLHWPVPQESLRLLVPRALEIETFDGGAWVGVVPFEMRGIRVRFAPAVPTAHHFPELNVRTYVRLGDRQGVYFFSLDASSWLAVIGARIATGLPYFHARMQIRRDEDRIGYVSSRTHPGAVAAELACEYHADGPVFTSEPGSFEFWSTERYSLFSRRGAHLLRLDIEHPRWPLQRAEARIERNTMAAASGTSLPATAPHALFAARLDVTAYWPRNV